MNQEKQAQKPIIQLALITSSYIGGSVPFAHEIMGGGADAREIVAVWQRLSERLADAPYGVQLVPVSLKGGAIDYDKASYYLDEQEDPYAAERIRLEGQILPAFEMTMAVEKPKKNHSCGSDPFCVEIHPPAVDVANPDDFSGAVLIGGDGCAGDFPQSEDLGAFINSVDKRGGPILAIGQGAYGLAKLENIAGRKMTGYSTAETVAREREYQVTKVAGGSVEEVLRKRGADFSCGDKFEVHTEPGEVGDNLITAQNAKSTIEGVDKLCAYIEKTYFAS